MMLALPMLGAPLTLAGGIVGALLLGLPRSLPRLALKALGAAALVGAAFAALGAPEGAALPLVLVDGPARFLQALFCLAALPVVFWGKEDEVPVALTLGSVLGMCLLATAGNALMLFLGLELMSIPAYLLVSRGRKASGLEGSIKYFFAGSVAGSLFLMGTALRYVAGRSLTLAPMDGPLAEAGLSLMAAAALFKVGAVPLHFWLPEVYESSDEEVAAFFSTGMKAAAVLFLMRLAAAAPTAPVVTILPWLGAATALYGAVLGLRQTSLQRLLAYSSISHAGLLVLGVGAWAAAGAAAGAALSVLFYLAVYLVNSAGSFLWLRSSGTATRSQLRGYASAHPWAAAAFAILLLSLAGIPPTGGFLAKLLVLWDGAKAGLWIPVLAGALSSLIGLGYYLGLVRDMWLEPAEGPEPTAGPCGPAAGLLAILALAAGLGPWLLRVVEAASR